MSDLLPRDELRRRADELIDKLLKVPSMDDMQAAGELLVRLRNRREFGRLMALAEALGRVDPTNFNARTFYVQALIETDKASVAADVARAIINSNAAPPEVLVEAQGLLGRACKQIFIDAQIKDSELARRAMAGAIEAYAMYPQATWHAVNVLALLDNCARRQVAVESASTPQMLAAHLLAQLERTPPQQRDAWHLAMVAEASLGTGNWKTIESSLRQYVTAPGVEEFHLRSTLRQFTEIWNLGDNSEHEQTLLDIIRAQLLKLENGAVELPPAQINAGITGDKSTYEAILGKEEAKTVAWWGVALERARSVVAIYQKLGDRWGSGFLVRAGDFGRTPADELLVLTNFHVVNRDGVRNALDPEHAEVAFEAGDASRQKIAIREVLWESVEDNCDAALLRLAAVPPGIAPMPIAKNLPTLDGRARVYVIGHPGGRALSISFQDNELLDHEGPAAGKPVIPGVVRVHYRAPTEGGSSGSPVFNGSSWEVIALHHKGGTLGMPRLNGLHGTYGANEGVWLKSIVEQTRAQPAS